MLGSAFLLLDPCDETRQRTARSSQIANDALVICVREEPEPVCCFGFDVNFIERSTRLAEKLPPFAIREATLAFPEVTEDSYRSASDLRREAVELVSGKSRRHFVNGDNQIECALIHNEITKRF